MNTVTLKLLEICPHCQEDIEVQFIQLYNPLETAKTITYSLECFGCKKAIVFVIEWPIVEYRKMGE